MFIVRQNPKTFRDVLFTAGRYLATIYVMAMVNDMADARGVLLPESSKPLPDLGHEIVPFWPETAPWTDTILIALYLLVIARCLMARRRYELICAFVDMHVLLMLIRCLTVTLTSMPAASPYCLTRLQTRPYPIMLNPLMKMIEPGGMRSWCNDLVFSGHTLVYMLASLFMTDALSSGGGHWLFTAAAYPLTFAGIFFLIAGRLHYSMDIFVAMTISTLVYLHFRPEIVVNFDDDMSLASDARVARVAAATGAAAADDDAATSDDSAAVRKADAVFEVSGRTMPATRRTKPLADL